MRVARSVSCSILVLLGIIGLALQGTAQNIDYARKVVDDLCSPKMAGRGYVRNGAKLAADYIKSEYKTNKLKFFGQDYFQPFGYQAVAYTGKVDVEVDGVGMLEGYDFIPGPGCPIVKGVFNIVWVDSATIDDPVLSKEFLKTNFFKTFLVIDLLKGKKCIHKDLQEKVLTNRIRAKGVIYANLEKLTWSPALEWAPYPVLQFLSNRITRTSLSITLDIESEINDYGMNNVIGYVEGTKYPDSFLVITAHYDHLGMLGPNALFPGANDNASGVAMMLDFMTAISKKPLDYSVAFMAFAGEEIGLLGSLYYTQTPLFPLKNISMLINLDLMGTGDKGMTVVNATLYPKEFQQLQLLNLEKDYLPTVNPRGKAQNSDHYYFTEQGVKSFFFYLMGEYKYYHDTEDSPKALTFSRYEQAYSLIYEFMNEYSTSQQKQ